MSDPNDPNAAAPASPPKPAPRKSTERCIIRGAGKGLASGTVVPQYGINFSAVTNDLEADVPSDFIEDGVKAGRFERKKG